MPNQARRKIELVVDDLTLTLESSPYVRQALKKFVDKQQTEIPLGYAVDDFELVK